jgi:hypothetical protein
MIIMFFKMIHGGIVQFEDQYFRFSTTVYTTCSSTCAEEAQQMPESPGVAKYPTPSSVAFHLYHVGRDQIEFGVGSLKSPGSPRSHPPSAWAVPRQRGQYLVTDTPGYET